MILQEPFAIPTLAFIPTRISGIKLWLDANQMGLSDGTSVTTWSDVSGSANDFSQSTSGNKPVFHTNIINGLPAVQFDGSDDFMSHTGTIAAQPVSVFIVTQPTANTSSQKTYACFTHSSGGSYFVVARLSTNFWGTFTNADLSSGNALSSGSNYLLENTAASGSTFLYQKGVQVATSATTEVGSGSNSGLGKDLVNSGREYAGYIAEVIVYNTVLSSGDRVRVENYLIAKYAL